MRLSERLQKQLDESKTPNKTKATTTATKPKQRRKPRFLASTGFQGGLSALEDRAYSRSREFRMAVKLCDVRQADDKLVDFVRRFLRKGLKIGVPLMVEIHQHDLAYIYHATRRDLPSEAYELLGHMGQELDKQYRLGVVWGGPMCPHYWRSGWLPREPDIAPLPPFPEPLEHTPF